jgi:type VI secretion system protein ImpH
MAGADGHALDSLTGTNARALRRAEFFEVVRRVLEASGDAAIGGDTRPADEPVRFRAVTGLRHPDREIAALGRAAPGEPVRIDVAFMGLTGPAGVMPDFYSDRLVEQRRARDDAMARFLDLFTHRAISHFYRAWAKYRLPVRFGEGTRDRPDAFAQALAAFAGIARDDGGGRELAMAGPLARRVRSAGAVRRIVSALFDLPVSVIELRPRWIEIPPSEQTRLGGGGREGSFARLGATAVAGGFALDHAGRFRLRIGPLDLRQFRAFFEPDGPRTRLFETVRFAVGPNVAFDVQLVLRREAVPAMRLGGGALPPALGQNSWLLAGPAERDRDEALLSISGQASRKATR